MNTIVIIHIPISPNYNLFCKLYYTYMFTMISVYACDLLLSILNYDYYKLHQRGFFLLFQYVLDIACQLEQYRKLKPVIKQITGLFVLAK
ncbi:MAG: hypothetical protein A2Y23_09745 [Clostridiales bacterium GWB2_37_7]|nr:MAG: hypothetical protein A2Y23_09745 [Clostridiales bacterium GWB2_37_7]